MNRAHDKLPPELEGIAGHLEQERPSLSPLELDSLKRRVMSRTSRVAPQNPRGSFMKSRLTIISMLAAGLLMSGTGATLAVDGLSTANNAAEGQYGSAAPKGDVLGDFQSAEETGDQVPGAIAPTKAGDNVAARPTPAQPARQVELGTSTGSLPFTGYAGITILLMGLALLGTGLVLRRHTRAQ